MVKVKRERLEDECKASIDRVSLLPDELLGFMLSLLPLKEAIATSMLSRRWRCLWTLTTKVDLDGTASLSRLKSYNDIDLLRHERCKYIESVNRVIVSLNSSSSANLEEFRVLFDLSQSETAYIDDWLSYAVSRKVERLELNLIHVVNYDRRYYSFPYKSWNFPSNLRVLKQVIMNFVNVNGEDVSFLVGNCPLLEQLSVSLSEELYYVEIIGSFPSFKCLELYLCGNLESIVIRDSGVVCIKYNGGNPLHRFLISNVPLLTELWIFAILPNRIKGLLGMFESVLPQIHMLKLYFQGRLSSNWRWRDPVDIFPGVVMRNLKLLVVSLGRNYQDTYDPLPMSDLITASPHLQRLVVEATHYHSEGKNMFRDGAHGRITPRACFHNEDCYGDARVYYDGYIPRAYYHLREVEFIGYRGVTNHFDMILELVQNGVALESIIVDPRSFKFCEHRPWDRVARHNFEDEMFARAHAKYHLRKYVPSRINVKIL